MKQYEHFRKLFEFVRFRKKIELFFIFFNFYKFLKKKIKILVFFCKFFLEKTLSTNPTHPQVLKTLQSNFANPKHQH
jgi:hypothetical protein